MKSEYWVMRVLLHQGRKVQLDLLTPTSRAEVEVQLGNGKLAQLPDGSIAEPVEVFEEEIPAHAHREQLRRKHPNEDFRVILSTGGV
jgi:hypothetical protein